MQQHLVIDVSKTIAQVVRHSHWRQTWFEQHKHVEEIQGSGRLKLLDEETLRATVRTAVKDGSPGGDRQEVTKQGLTFRSLLMKPVHGQ